MKNNVIAVSRLASLSAPLGRLAGAQLQCGDHAAERLTELPQDWGS